MRVLIIYLMLLFSLSVFSVKPQQIIDSMVIKVAPWDAVTDIGIECSNFETSIDYQVCDEQNSCAISKIVSELNRLDKSLKGGEDMRCKIIFYHSGEALWSCCIGKITTKIESEYYYTSPSLIAVIDSIVNSHQTQLRKEVIEKWDYTPSLNKVYQYMTSQSGRLYDGIEIKEDLEFTVFCNVGEDGRTTNVQFTKNRNGKDKVIPVQITSVLEEILYHEIRWAVPPRHYADWVPIKISIKSNVSKNKTGAKAYDSILVDKVWTERRTIFYSEEEMDSIGEGPMIEEGGIACGYAGCIKIEFLGNHRFRKVYPYGKVCLGSWYLKDDVLTIVYDKRERKEKKRYRFKIKYREKKECPTLYLFEINKIACYIFCNYK
ncbi:MAG: hypothetical protein IK003_05580 [Prevotella sp.]|nr:hypothetical protein [Prevotella sp.]